MMMGPEPMIKIFEISVRLGIDARRASYVVGPASFALRQFSCASSARAFTFSSERAQRFPNSRSLDFVVALFERYSFARDDRVYEKPLKFCHPDRSRRFAKQIIRRVEGPAGPA